MVAPIVVEATEIVAVDFDCLNLLSKFPRGCEIFSGSGSFDWKLSQSKAAATISLASTTIGATKPLKNWPVR